MTKEEYDKYKKQLAEPSMPMPLWKSTWIGMVKTLKEHPEYDPILAQLVKEREEIKARILGNFKLDNKEDAK